MGLSSTFVCIMGMATVFAGLICLIIICSLLGVISRNTKKGTPTNSSNQTSAKSVAPQAAAPAASPIENREELVAAISAAIAEELGEDVTNIRILSLRRI